MNTLLIVDDEAKTREGLKAALEADDREITVAENGQRALSILKSKNVDLMVTDIKMPGMDGMTLLKEARQSSPGTEVVVLTGYGSVEQAVEAMREGAYNYLLKPVNLDELDMIVSKVFEKKALELRAEYYERQSRGMAGAVELIGVSRQMRDVIETTQRVAKTKATILITGESGTGKEVTARVIHNASDRASGRFQPVNCSALAESLLETELFGHERGAFTGAYKQKKGYFEIANGGTLFLDEIGEISHSTQTKLLRFLETKEFERVGGTATVRVDVRLIAATNADLERLVQERRFRQDLYYRLQVVTIHLPPLRERKEDIPLLVQRFLHDLAIENNRPGLQIEPEALTALQGCDWPGNVRQLRNTVESMVVLSRGNAIKFSDLPAELKAGGSEEGALTIPVGTPLRDVERRMILETLRSHSGNRTRTAETLGIGRRTLIRKLQEYELAERGTEPEKGSDQSIGS